MLPLLQKGFLVGLLLALSAYLGIAWMGLSETQDAELVEAVQVSLQSTISEGVTALNMPPDKIHPANFINAARVTFPKGVQVDKNLHLSIRNSPRGAIFKISHQGDLSIVSLINFTRYDVANGRIVRNTQVQNMLPTWSPATNH